MKRTYVHEIAVRRRCGTQHGEVRAEREKEAQRIALETFRLCHALADKRAKCLTVSRAQHEHHRPVVATDAEVQAVE